MLSIHGKLRVLNRKQMISSQVCSGTYFLKGGVLIPKADKHTKLIKITKYLSSDHPGLSISKYKIKSKFFMSNWNVHMLFHFPTYRYIL